jgi:uncharacterized protein YdhG (YjbR/CyaY superfamily)
MNKTQNSSEMIEAYIAGFPAEVQEALRSIRATILAEAPQAEERISYGMPGFYLNGPLVYFGAFTRHIGFYPNPSGITAFQEELAKYPSSKGGVRFALDKPMPLDLIARIVRFRVTENTQKQGK